MAERMIYHPRRCAAAHKHWVCLLLAVMMLACVSAPALADGDGHVHKHLTAGFFAFDGYHNVGENGERSGYGYELLQLIARYAHVNYTYHGYEHSLHENLNMLARGEIDLVSAIKKTPERIERFDFSERSVGSASTLMTIKAGNENIITADYATYNGLRIGVLKDGTRAEELRAFAAEKGFSYEPVYFDNTLSMSAALQNGDIDALVTSSLRVLYNEWPIDSFNEAPIYIAVRKGDTETLSIINDALKHMEMEENNWRTDLEQKYYTGIRSTIPFFTETERNYLRHQAETGRVFRVLVNPERYPYSYIKDGKLVGIMPDLFDMIAQRADIRYEWIIPSDREDYAQRMLMRETDICIDMTPDYDSAEKNGYAITDMYLSAPFSWVRRNDSNGNIEHAAQLTHIARTPAYFAYGNTYHNIDYTSYATEQECLDSVRNGINDAYCTYTFNAEKIVLNDPSGSLMATVAHTENQFAIGIAHDDDRYLVTILNTVLSCLEDWEHTAIIRRHTSVSAPTFSVLELLQHNPNIRTTYVLCAIAGVLLIMVISQQIIHQKRLKQTIRIQNRKLDNSLKNMLDVLATAIEFRSSESGDHVHRIRSMVLTLLQELQRKYPNDYPLNPESLDQIANASVLHDVGKIAIPDHILNKPGKLTKEEFEIIKQHTVKGCAMLETIPDMQHEPLYQYAWDICRWHHERWDGRGYPDNLKGNDIPIWAQVVAMADVYDALISPRVYKTAFSKEKAIDMIVKGECGAFNPKLLEAFVSVADKLPEAPQVSPLEEQNAPAGRNLTSLMLNAFNTFLQTTDALIFVKDIDCAYRAVSKSFAECVGLDPEKMLCHTDLELLEDKARAQRFMQEDIQLLTSGEDLDGMLDVLQVKNNMVSYGATSKHLITDSQGRRMGILGITRDVTATYYAQKHQQIELQNLHTPPRDMYFFIFVDVTDWHIISEKRQTVKGLDFQTHDTLEHLLAAARKNIIDPLSPAFDFYKEFTAEKLNQAYLEGDTKLTMEYQRRVSTGQERWVRDELHFMIDPLSGHLCLTLGVFDIHEKKEAEQRLKAQADRDELTGLLNRASARRLISERLQNSHDQKHALFMIDIDNLKQVNDNLGHIEGDRRLSQVGSVLRESFRSNDLVARIGGDEFIVLMTDVTDTEHVQNKAATLLKALNIQVSAKKNISLSASIGISVFPEDGTTREELYSRADEAMYCAKRNGKNRYAFYKIKA